MARDTQAQPIDSGTLLRKCKLRWLSPKENNPRGYMISFHIFKNLYNHYNALFRHMPKMFSSGEPTQASNQNLFRLDNSLKYQRFIPMCPWQTVHSASHMENTWARTQKPETIKKQVKKGWGHSANAERKFFQRETSYDNSDLSGTEANGFFSSTNLGKNNVARHSGQHRPHFTRLILMYSVFLFACGSSLQTDEYSPPASIGMKFKKTS